MEALVLQQEIAEELERERKRNQKELASMEHRNSTLARQRDEAQRIVVHLRSLIDGQTHHMEHIIRNLASSTDLGEYIDQALENSAQESAPSPARSMTESPKSMKRLSRPGSRVRLSSAFNSRSNSASDNIGLEMDSVMEKAQRRLSQMSMPDVADRYLKDKTDAIAAIIRNISEQCAAAVEGLHLAQDAENDEAEAAKNGTRLSPSNPATREEGSEAGESESGSLNAENRVSSIPPTPDLVHNRSSTSMSMVSTSTIAERTSQQYNPGEIPTKIVEDEDEHLHETEGFTDPNETPTVSKKPSQGVINAPASRVVS